MLLLFVSPCVIIFIREIDRVLRILDKNVGDVDLDPIGWDE